MVVDRRAPCYGRDDLIRTMLELADDRRCLLLFGGRQAGKTTMLRHAERVSLARLHQSGGYSEETLAVYVNLMALPYDAGPSEFYRFLLDRAVVVCADVFDEVRRVMAEADGQVRTIPTTDAFGEELQHLLRATHGVRRVIFLLDEAGRVLGRRFPRAFQDNLYSLLYVDQSDTAERVALVFSGAQELAGFCEDETSPLGSRAEQLDVVNLGFDAFSEFIHDRMPTANERVREHLFEETGGHAGLAARLVETCADRGATSVDRVQVVTQQVADGSRRLFEHWMAHFSEDARVALKWIATQPISLRRGEVAQLLADGGRDRFGAERTWHELQYVGVSKVDSEGRLAKCNALFWRYYQEFAPGSMVNTADELRIWDLIKETEVALRSLVYMKYREKWPGREVAMMKRVLRDEWKSVEKVRRQAKAAYPLSPSYERPLMDCMYLGQLGALVESNQAWDMFKGLFGDKREFGRMLRHIFPVRNDIAHFVTVPPKELQRCGITCDDMLVILRQVIDEGGS